MKTKITRDEVVQKIKDGWKFGYSGHGIQNPRAWLQKNGMCKGGESIDVNFNTVNSMLKRGIIERAEKQDNDPFWLRRFRLKESKEGNGK